MNRVYAISPRSLRKMLRRLVLRSHAVAAAGFVFFGLYLILFAPAVKPGLLFLILSIVALAYFLVIFFQYRHELRVLYSIRVEINPVGIIYREIKQLAVLITSQNYGGAEEQHRGLLVQLKVPPHELFIPHGLIGDGDFELRQILASWGPFRKLERRRLKLLFRLRLVSFTGAVLILLWINQMWVVVSLGVFLFLFGTYTEMRLMHVHSAEPGVTRLYSASYAFLVFTVLMKSCLLGFRLMF